MPASLREDLLKFNLPEQLAVRATTLCYFLFSKKKRVFFFFFFFFGSFCFVFVGFCVYLKHKP